MAGFALLLASAGAWAAAGLPVRGSFDVAAPTAVATARTASGRELVYELRLSNLSPDPLVVSEVEVLDAGSGARLARFSGEDLVARVAPASGGATVAAGLQSIVYLEIDLAAGREPRVLTHKIAYRLAGDSRTLAVRGGFSTVEAAPVLVLRSPLTGGPWVAVHSPAWPRGHRRVTYTVGGRLRIPGRFALDFVKVDDQGRTTHGAPDATIETLGYGAQVLAVADASVVAVRDDMAESPSIEGNPQHAIGDATGNYVALQLPKGRVAFYEHLKPGSVRVRVGDRVRAGQVIAALGFTGDSTGPHLHFHVADANSPLGAEGVPFAFDRFEVIGSYPDIAQLGRKVWAAPEDGRGSGLRVAEWPQSNVVIRFDE